MSYSFTTVGEMVWDPARQVGKLYLHQVQTVADLLDVPSGLRPRIDGTCQVDPETFAVFVAKLQVWYLKSNHSILRSLAHGVLAVSLALQLRLGQQPSGADGDEWAALLGEAHRLEREMPR